MATTGPISAMHRFCRLPTPSYEKIYADANNILDDIISQCHAYRRPNQQDISLEEMVSFLSHGCKTLQNASILLKSKFAQVVNIYLPLMKSTIHENCVNQLVTFLCQSLTSVKSSLVSEFMKALALTLTGTGALLNEDSIIQLLGEEGVIWMYLAQSDWILSSYSIQCLGNICLRSQRVGVMAKENIQLCYSKLLDKLRMFVFEDTNELEHFKLINVTLKAIQKILSGITMHDNIIEPEFAVLLLKIFLIYGLPGYQSIVNRLKLGLPSRKSDDLDTMEKIYPTKKKEKSAMTKKVNAKKGRKKKKRNLNNSIQEAYDSVNEAESSGYGFVNNWRQIQSPSSSESEFSDSESSQSEQLNSITSKIRYNCALTLQEILRCCDRRSRFACWLAVIPDTLTPDEPSLLYSFLKETTTKMQSTLLLTIMELIDGSRGFLDSVITQQNIASSVMKADRPFTPYSVRIVNSLHLLHDEIISFIESCKSELLKEKVIKCLTLLMLNTPYKKLQKDYLSNILRLVIPSLHSTEATLCQSVITCIAASISIQPDNMHVYQIISSSELPKDIKSTTKKKENALVTPKTQEAGEAWLIKHCLQILSLASKDGVFELRLVSEYIQLLTVLLRCHPQLMSDEHIDKLIHFCTNVFMFSTDVSISFHAIKLLEELSKHYNSNDQRALNPEKGLHFWRKMISGAIPQYLNSEPIKPVKGQAAVCDWLSNIGSHVFEKLKTPEQIFVKTVLIGMTENEEPLISAAAVRAIGVTIDYDSIIDDVWFVVDATRSILKQLNNASLSVRLKAAWSLANLCDFIAKHGFLANEYPETLILDLLRDSTKAACGNEKVSPNGVRAIGNLLKAFDERLFGKAKFEEGVKESICAIIKNIKTGQMKTRWNACYACRYIFENVDCPIGTADWTDELFTALLQALGECKNFKVRISAAIALSSLNERSKYGNKETFNKVWMETLKALEKSEELTDFTEFKHKENLQEQTTVLLLHLISLATSEDIQLMQEMTKEHQDILLVNCRKCLTRIEVCQQLDEPTTTAPLAGASADAYVGYPVKNEISEEEKQKLLLIKKHIENAKINLCNAKNIDKQKTFIDVLTTAIGLKR